MADHHDDASHHSVSHHLPAHTEAEDQDHVQDARPILPRAAFFMGDLRDGLPMVRVFVCANNER